MKLLYLSLLLLLFLLLPEACLPTMNVLFMMTDDLRPELSIYGRPGVHSPNFARLAAKGMVFDMAYTQYPVCHPSRASLLTGVRPDTHNIATFEDATNAPWFDNIFTILTRSGYHSMGIGKLLHQSNMDDQSLFDSGRWDGKWYQYQNIEMGFLNSSTTPDAYRPDEAFRDYEIASRGIEGLELLRDKVRQGFKNAWVLGIGFKQPHTWYHFPKKYIDLYPKNSPAIIRLEDQDLVYPNNTPTIGYRCCALDAITYMNELGKLPSTRKETPRFKMRITKQGREELTRGYLAGVSFLDAQLGRVLDELDRLDLWKDTIVIFVSDHGMSIGEKGMWEKNTLFEETTRVPLIIADPRYPAQHGKHYQKPVEIVSVPQTLYDLVGIDPVFSKCPRAKYCHNTDGESLAPIIKNGPNHVLKNDFALSQTRVCRDSSTMKIPLTTERGSDHAPTGFFAYGCDANNPISKKYTFMGYSMRNLEYRYTAWFPYIPRGGGAPGRPDLTKDIFDEELYYHRFESSSKLLFDERNERYNLIDSADPRIIEVREFLRTKLLRYLSTEALFGLGELRDKYLRTLGKNRRENEEKSNTSYRISWHNVDSVKKLRKNLRREERLIKRHEVKEATQEDSKDMNVVYQSALLKSIGIIRNETRTRESDKPLPISLIKDTTAIGNSASRSNPKNKLRMMFDHGT